jgi:hypothetical protein
MGLVCIQSHSFACSDTGRILLNVARVITIKQLKHKKNTSVKLHALL